VVDLVGGPYVNASLHAMAERGRLVLVGLVPAERHGRLRTRARARLALRGTVMRARRSRSASPRRGASPPRWARGSPTAPCAPRSTACSPLEAVADAHRALESDATTGKVVLTVA
jgi:NADPH:quinone reductase-like Zn-dependent oxidoreductase